MQRAGLAQRWMRFEGPRDPVLAQSKDFIDRGVAGISSS